MRWSACALAALLAVSLAGSSNADETPADATTSTTAEKLFLEGRVLAERGDVEGACLRFETSHQLEPTAVGPVLNLALCKERLFQYATAAALFREALERSRGVRADRVELAEQHLKGLLPKISSMRVEVDGPRPPGLKVRLDDRVLPEASWGVDMPTDGGPHVVRASAPHRETFVIKVSLERDHGDLRVHVPPLDEVRGTHRAGYYVGGAGLAVFIGGAILGGSVAARCGGFFRDTCEAANGLPDADRSSMLRRMDSQAWVSNVTVGVGLIAVGVGLYLVLRSPTERGSGELR
jgi:hypothetical protein